MASDGVVTSVRYFFEHTTFLALHLRAVWCLRRTLQRQPAEGPASQHHFVDRVFTALSRPSHGMCEWATIRCRRESLSRLAASVFILYHLVSASNDRVCRRSLCILSFHDIDIDRSVSQSHPLFQTDPRIKSSTNLS